MTLIMDNGPERGIRYQTNILHLTGVKLDISDLFKPHGG